MHATAVLKRDLARVRAAHPERYVPDPATGQPAATFIPPKQRHDVCKKKI